MMEYLEQAEAGASMKETEAAAEARKQLTEHYLKDFKAV